MSGKSGAWKRMGAIFNRALASVSMRLHVAAANVWRDSYNPLRSLTITRAVHLLEEGERGAYADLQWTYRFIEMQDATLGALIERRTSAIQELDWDIKTLAEVPAGKQQVAARQQAALKQAYNRIGNLSAALEALEMAAFRGFARLEKVRDGNGDIIELAPVDQWFWVRAGLYGQWMLNRNSTLGTNTGDPVPEPSFVTREVTRPINRVALIAFVRKALSQKDWDGFVETYGIPAVFIVMPDDVPEGKEDEYLEMADQVTGDARGVLPGGSDVKTVDNGARGVNPFKDHISYQDEQVILRGTGGKLTMLAESGSGTLAGNAHADTFEAIARAEAREISELLRKHIDAEIIERVTPGEEAYAYFELAANEETDTKAIVADVVSLSKAGYQVAREWIVEKTGYELVNAEILKSETLKQETPQPEIRNRETANDGDTQPLQDTILAALSEDLQPLGKALAGAMQAGDEAVMRAALKKISEEMPEFLESAALEEALAEEFTTALLEDGDIRNGRWMTVNGRRFYKPDKGESREPYTKAKRDHFGPLAKPDMTPDQAEERLGKIIDHAVRKKTSMTGAAYREGLGRIDLPWGTPGDKANDYQGGSGLSHILAKHGPDDVQKLPAVLARGEIKPHAGSRGNPGDPNKRQIETEDYIAIVAKEQQSRAWLLTGFTRRP